MKKLLIASMFILFATINVVVLVDKNEVPSLSLITNMKTAIAELDSWKFEQDWIYMDGYSCFDYICIMGEEYESICECDYTQGICPKSETLDNCIFEGIDQMSGPTNCSPNGWTQQPCSDY